MVWVEVKQPGSNGEKESEKKKEIPRKMGIVWKPNTIYSNIINAH